MSRNYTFHDEYNWLASNLPHSLNGSNDYYREYFNELINLLDNDNSRESIDNSFEIINPPANQYFFQSLGTAESFNEIFELLRTNEDVEFTDDELANLRAELGTDAYGCYLPMHNFYNSKKIPWGIYLFPSLILQEGKRLYNKLGKMMGLSLEEVQKAFAYGVYRHEAFHFQVEQFATKNEILSNKIIYKKYKENVYSKLSNSEEWLEEALAENAVLSSTYVNRNTHISKKQFQELYRLNLDASGRGYSDYHCKKYDGPQNAHRLFASQIITSVPKIDNKKWSTKICTVNANENIIPFSKIVPLYQVKLSQLRAIKDASQLFDKIY